MQLTTLKGLGSVGSGGGAGLQGPTGPAGITGPTGPVGPVGTAGAETGGIIAHAYFPGNLMALTGATKQYLFKTTIINTILLSVQIPAVGSPITIRINKNGTPFMTYTLAANSNYIRFSAQALSVAVDDYLTVDIMSIGTTYPGSNLTLQLIV